MHRYLTSLRLYLTFGFALAATAVSAQYTLIGQNSFGGTNIYGPMSASSFSDTFFSRHAYIYPASTLGRLQHGDTIRSVEFFKSGTNSFTGSPDFRIYMGMSSTADFGSGDIHWRNEAQKCDLVFDDHPNSIAGSTTGFKRFDFNKSFFVFDTTQGSNLKILVEYIQYQTQTTPVNWVYESDFTVPLFISNNETKYISNSGLPTDSTVGSNVRKPYIRINYPRYDTNLDVNRIYCLGRVPTLMNRPDSIYARVENIGLKSVYNHPLYLKVEGSNNFLDSIMIDSLEPYQQKIVVFGSHKPDTQGTETIYVYPGNDDDPTDNNDSVNRIVGYNVYSHADPFQANAGGIGFNGSTGDFVAKFYTDSIIHINQIKVDFALSGRDFQLGIWEENSRGLPGKNLFTSDSLTSVAGTYILSVLPRVQVNGGYFVGIRQTSTTNVAFAYQPESPVRPNAFYFAAPLGDTSWVPFDPGFDFKFNIQPRIQVANDVAVLNIAYPSTGDTIEYNQYDSIAPKATIINYGFNDQKAPFDVVCEITNQFGQKVFGDTVSITMKSNDTAVITFSKTLSLNNYGKMYMRVYTNLYNDKVLDNDTLDSQFDIVVRYDVTVENYFDPQENQKFELNSSRIGPVVRVVNVGASTQSNIRVTSRIRQDDKIARVETKSVSLTGTESVILAYDSFTIPWWGDVVFEAFTWGVIDSFSINDTARVNVYVDKSHDVGIRNVRRPVENARYERNTEFRPYVDIRNYGVKDQDTVPIMAMVQSLDGDTIYYDIINLAISKFSTAQALFKDFQVPDTVTTLIFHVQTLLPTDQDPSNDTMRYTFEVVTARDLAVRQWLVPLDTSVYNNSSSITPQILLQNNGNHVLTTPPVVYCEFRNSAGTLLYQDSAIQESGLPVGAFDTLTFSKSFTPTLKDRYTGMVWHRWDEDGERSNDTLNMSFEVSFAKSIEMVSINKPVNDKVYDYNGQPFAPQFTVHNDGLEDVLSPTTYVMQIRSSDGGVVYQHSGKLDSIKRDQSTLISLPVAFHPNQTGRFNTTVYIKNAEDQYYLDDTIRNVFFVAKTHDITPIRIDFPNESSVVNTSHTYAPRATFRNIGDSASISPFSVSFQIMDGTTMIYNTNETIELRAGDSTTVVFDSSFVAPDRGSYLARAITRYGLDQEKNNDTLESNFTIVFGTGININQNQGSKVYPNPASSSLTIERSPGYLYAVLYNTLGQEFDCPVIHTDRTTMMDVSALVPGIYNLTITYERGIEVVKVLIE